MYASSTLGIPPVTDTTSSDLAGVFSYFISFSLFPHWKEVQNYSLPTSFLCRNFLDSGTACCLSWLSFSKLFFS